MTVTVQPDSSQIGCSGTSLPPAADVPLALRPPAPAPKRAHSSRRAWQHPYVLRLRPPGSPLRFELSFAKVCTYS